MVIVLCTTLRPYISHLSFAILRVIQYRTWVDKSYCYRTWWQQYILREFHIVWNQTAVFEYKMCYLHESRIRAGYTIYRTNCSNIFFSLFSSCQCQFFFGTICVNQTYLSVTENSEANRQICYPIVGAMYFILAIYITANTTLIR